ncbi:MAG: PKD domain-containing protein, partial [Acidobacteriota bacterium]
AWTSASVGASAGSTPPPSSTSAAPVANAGGPYSGTRGSALTVDGSGSSDADGSIAAYLWTWGDEVLVGAADTAATTIVGSAWARASSSGAAGGVALVNPDNGAAKKTAAAASPSSYVEVRFYAAAGVPYHVWFRMRAEGDAYTNDSMFVQFSGAVTATGAAVNRIGTTAAAIVILENGSGAGVSGWGWNDDGYGTLGTPVYFATPGVQTLRVQQREDGVMWDQLVVSAGTYVTTRPGSTQGDSTVLTAASGSGASPSHVYPAAGQYPIELTVTDDKGAAGSALTSATIK